MSIPYGKHATNDVAISNLFYQPSNAWMIYGLQVAAYALKPGGRLYVVGAKDRGVLSIAKRMQSLLETLRHLLLAKGNVLSVPTNRAIHSTCIR